MTAMDLLRALLHGAAVTQEGSAAFPADELRYVLEFGQIADADLERLRLSALLKSEAFVLAPFEGPGLEKFLILRFQGVEPTLPRRDMFSIGYELCDALGLVSAEPDLDTPFFADPLPGPPLRETESAQVLGPLCWVPTEPPTDRTWALTRTGVPTAWALSRGEGILVGQPDSGVATHDEIEPDMLRLDLAWNALNGTGDPTDPLRDGAANPGHGTGTASVLASRAGGIITGAAPAAELVPIRCLDDVKIFNAAPVAAAVAHAGRVGCHVISMSLGGVPSRALHRAIQQAIADDIIVVAAAGNCVGIVVWPARYNEVIAVAGTNSDDEPWKGSSRGAAVDISAPGELVWRAQRARIRSCLRRCARPRNILRDCTRCRHRRAVARRAWPRSSDRRGAPPRYKRPGSLSRRTQADGSQAGRLGCRVFGGGRCRRGRPHRPAACLDRARCPGIGSRSAANGRVPRR
ncbi:S8 family serine peptidase [Novosphingobium sp. YJ-S2-02]|uniref:S8 family serine peptidase n=1 Tax=Novosphingobium aureum TaxID=2792964 RepID=A0A931H938_9SPHN|nr:S8 family serine peptidase [Novosphingobium aureum]